MKNGRKQYLDTYGSPINGEQVEHYEDGTVKSKITYIGGIREGAYCDINEMGKVKESGNWIGGTKLVEKDYFDNGVLKNDINHELGTGKRYDESGYMVMSWRKLPDNELEVRMRNDQGGVVKWCERDGKKTGIMIERNRVGLIINETKWSKGLLDGKSTHYYDNGYIKSENSYKNGTLDGPSIMYYEDGNLMQIVNYKSNLLNGRYLKFNKQGEIRKYGDYIYGKESYQGKYVGGKLVDIAHHNVITGGFQSILMSVGINTKIITKLKSKSKMVAPKELKQK